MKYFSSTIIFILISGLLLYAYKVNSSLSNEISFFKISVNDVPAIFTQLKDKGRDSSYSTFVFFPRNPNEESHVEIQFSIENGTIGFDWVLLGDIKSRDTKRFTELTNKYGYSFTEMTGNGVEYLRVEDGDLVNLCRRVMVEMYGVKPSSFMELIAARFEVIGFPLSTR